MKDDVVAPALGAVVFLVFSIYAYLSYDWNAAAAAHLRQKIKAVDWVYDLGTMLVGRPGSPFNRILSKIVASFFLVCALGLAIYAYRLQFMK